MESDWIFGLLGGLMIGLAAALYLHGNGRVLGVSGIAGGLVDGSAGAETRERLVFIAGLVGAPALIALATRATESTGITANTWLVLLAGLLVGFGTRIGNGCTSGHGVCGISRLSTRSIVATLCYICSGAVTVLLLRMLEG